MYLDYFSLDRHPFRITPDPSLFFPGGQDGRGVILNALIYGIQSGEGILKVVGEVGSGKTMLCRMLEEELPDHVEIVYIANPSLSAREILYAIAIELKLEVNSSTERLKVLHMIQDYLLNKHAEGGTVVVFVEEAQSMPLETLEEIRLLNNLETHQHKLMQIVLFGQPELDKILAQKNIRQLRERITHSFRLEPLSTEATSEYIRYRLNAAGCTRDGIFSPRAEKMIAKASSGLTRRINILADKSLLAAYADSPSRQPTQTGNEPLVLPRHVNAAIRDSDYKKVGLSPWLFGTLSFAVAIVLFAYILLSQLWPTALERFSEQSATVQISNNASDSVSPGSTAAVNGAGNDLQRGDMLAGAATNNAGAQLARAEGASGNLPGEPIEGVILREPLALETDITALAPGNNSSQNIAPADNSDISALNDSQPVASAVPLEQETIAARQSVAVNDTDAQIGTAAGNGRSSSGPATADTSASASTVATSTAASATTHESPAVQESPSLQESSVTGINEPQLAASGNTGFSGSESEAETDAPVSQNAALTAASESAESQSARVDRESLPVTVLRQEQPAESDPVLESPVAMVPSGLAELRMQPTADWLRALDDKNGYTIQLFSVPSTNPNGLEEYLQFLQLVSLLDDTYICFMPISSQSSGRWQVMHKEFGGVTRARQFIDSLPFYIQQYDPYVRNLNGVECSYPVERGRRR